MCGVGARDHRPKANPGDPRRKSMDSAASWRTVNIANVHFSPPAGVRPVSLDQYRPSDPAQRNGASQVSESAPPGADGARARNLSIGASVNRSRTCPTGAEAAPVPPLSVSGASRALTHCLLLSHFASRYLFPRPQYKRYISHTTAGTKACVGSTSLHSSPRRPGRGAVLLAGRGARRSTRPATATTLVRGAFRGGTAKAPLRRGSAAR